eukprot:gnl/Spiro4/28215_TR13962_c0_g1_i1.p1 gnl/Spiro4/28215_TR13962_c0_g1~~gnl/Spiro4/28215_TR13962_c0_g1_i1.p1  ORF type:complete len:365 (+),score=135.03 gnl/Spiro4/28215_TR13962_c0_g1_i1:39-1097(+)
MDIPTSKPTSKAVPTRLLPWIEKYRPRSINEVSQQTEVISALRNCISTTSNLPHLLFYGPAGTGKTSTILALAKDLYGPEHYKDFVLEMNASDERGINVVRSKIKNFAQVQVTHRPGQYPCPPFKIIILDEADAMTSDAQMALRRTMETYSRTTRFCLVCNFITRIIEPLASRCAKYRFRALDPEPILERLRFICQQENTTLSDECASALIDVSGGDLRKAITYLQSAHTLYGNNITPETLADMAGVIPRARLFELIQACQSNSFDRLQGVVNKLNLDGFAATQVISQLQTEIISYDDLSDIQKAHVCVRLAEADKSLCDGADDMLQLLDCCAFAMRVFCDLPLLNAQIPVM